MMNSRKILSLMSIPCNFKPIYFNLKTFLFLKSCDFVDSA